MLPKFICFLDNFSSLSMGVVGWHRQASVIRVKPLFTCIAVGARREMAFPNFKVFALNVVIMTA